MRCIIEFFLVIYFLLSDCYSAISMKIYGNTYKKNLDLRSENFLQCLWPDKG